VSLRFSSPRVLAAPLLAGLAELRLAAWGTVVLTAGLYFLKLDVGAHPWRDLVVTAAAVAGAALAVAGACRPRSAERRRSDALLAALLGGFAFIGVCTAVLALSTGPRDYTTDSSVYNHENALLVLDGRNPYTSDGAWYAATRLAPNAPATQLRRGRFARRTLYPSPEATIALAQAKLRRGEPAGPEFDPRVLHSYPALSFLVDVPFLWLGLPTVALASLLAVAALAAVLLTALPRRLRAAALLVVLGNLYALLAAGEGAFEAWALLPAALAFRLRDRRTLSPALLGLGCAVKQLVWPIAFLATVLAWRDGGPRAAARHAAIATAAFLLPNLPFALDAPAAWLGSLPIPVALPLFPTGFGLTALGTSGLLPLAPPVVYAAVELAAFAGLAWLFARRRRPVRAELALALATLPFLLAWRCSASYVWFVPALCLLVPTGGGALVRRLPRRGDEAATELAA
jgi:hypothetical protein